MLLPIYRSDNQFSRGLLRGLLLSALLVITASANAHHDDLHSILENEYRSEQAKARDQYRHPYETLMFFGLRPDTAVVELWPGGGWYSDIIAPYIDPEEGGQLTVGHFNPDTEHSFASFFQDSLRAYQLKVESNPNWYGTMQIKPFEPGKTEPLAEAGSIDMVLSFRNIHNWMNDGSFNDVVSEVRRMLKPGGVFGVVEHRANLIDEIDTSAENGYVNQQWFVRRLETSGFQLVAESPINGNLKDVGDYPNGVWTLPPNLRVPEGEDSQKYIDIGESDRFTLKFVKLGR